MENSEEIQKIKKRTSTEVRRVKAENKALKKELGQATVVKSKLQTELQYLLTELDELTTEKESERIEQIEAIERADEEYNATVLKINELRDTNSKRDQTMALETSWTDSLKATLEANQIKSANAQSNLEDELKQKDEHIDTLYSHL